MAEHRAVLRSGSHPRVVVNRNTVVDDVPWANGIKTGHTSTRATCSSARARATA